MIDKPQLENLIKERVPSINHPLGLEKVIHSIENADESIRSKVEEFLTTGKEPEMVVEGYSYDTLRKEHRMNPIAALLTLDYLLREPEKAKESLRRGHDYITKK